MSVASKLRVGCYATLSLPSRIGQRRNGPSTRPESRRVKGPRPGSKYYLETIE